MTLTYDQEVELVTKLLTASGMSEEDAGIAARVTTHSDFTGVYSHGLSRLTRYLKQFDCGALNPKPDIKIVSEEGSTVVFDCDNGLGTVNVNKAYDTILPKARENGIAIAVGRHSSNIGCAAYYGWRAVKDGVIALITCNTYAFSSPFGGADRMIGTNPISFAVPTNEQYPVVLDISTTNVAMGKIQAAEREGQAIPLGWANDYDGKPTTDPSKAFSLLPIAGHKGYGLAVMVDVLSTLLSKAAAGSDIGLFSKLQPENTGFCVILIDPAKFMPIEEFRNNADYYIRMMKGSRKAEGVEEIFMPGEIEQKKYEQLMKTGISFSENLEQELRSLGEKIGVKF